GGICSGNREPGTREQGSEGTRGRPVFASFQVCPPPYVCHTSIFENKRFMRGVYVPVTTSRERGNKGPGEQGNVRFLPPFRYAHPPTYAIPPYLKTKGL